MWFSIDVPFVIWNQVVPPAIQSNSWPDSSSFAAISHACSTVEGLCSSNGGISISFHPPCVFVLVSTKPCLQDQVQRVVQVQVYLQISNLQPGLQEANSGRIRIIHH